MLRHGEMKKGENRTVSRCVLGQCGFPPLGWNFPGAANVDVMEASQSLSPTHEQIASWNTGT